MSGSNGSDTFKGLKFHQKLHFKIIVLLVLISAVNYTVNFYFEKTNYGELERNITEITKSSVESVRNIVSANLKLTSERYIKVLVERIFFEQLNFLKDRAELKEIKEPSKIIDFCINSKEYQSLFANADRHD